jgi:hypothetical protein
MLVRVWVRAAKSKLKKTGVFRKKKGADQEIFDKKIERKTRRFFYRNHETISRLCFEENYNFC